MASLAETLRKRREESQLKRGPGGSLTRETPEEIQQLSSKAGLQAPPLTPVGAAAIGANPDQQKMQGTPAQKQAALSLAAQPPEQSLTTALRRQQSRTAMAAEEQQQKEKSQDMQNLGSLGQRVSGYIEAQKQKLQQAQPVQLETQTEFQGKDISSIKGLLEQFRSDPQNQQLLLQINQQLGYDINTQLDPAQVEQLYKSVTDTIASGAAGNIDDDLTVSDLVAQGNLGYTPQQLSELLGIPEQTITSLSVGQLRSEIDRVGQEEFARTQQLEQQAQSGLLGQAERQAARSASREMSSTGVRATEQDYRKLEQAIENADTVQFGGKEYQVDELLQDETISNIIKDYLESAPGSELRKQLDRSEPLLRDFINNNQAALQDAVSSMEVGAQEFRNIQESNKALKRIEGLELDDSIASALIPGYGTLQATRIDPNSVPLLKAFSEMPGAQRRQSAVNQLNEAVQKYPNLTDELSTLSTEQIAGLTLGKEGGNFDKYLLAREQKERISNINPGNTGSLIAEIFEGENLNSFQRKQQDSRMVRAFGFDDGLPFNIDTTSNLKQDALDSIQAGSLVEASTGNVRPLQKTSLPPVTMPSDSRTLMWMQAATPYLADGSIDRNEIEAMMNSGLLAQQTEAGNIEMLKHLEDLANQPNARIDRKAVQEKRQQSTDRNTQEKFSAVFIPGDYWQSLSGAAKLLEEGLKDPRTINPELMRQHVVNMATNEIRNGKVEGPIGALRSIKDEDTRNRIRSNPDFIKLLLQQYKNSPDSLRDFADVMDVEPLIAQIKGPPPPQKKGPSPYKNR